MAPRWRLSPKPKPRPVKTKKPTDFNIRESGTSLGELVPTQPLLDIPSPKTTDLPVPKTGLADTPEGKEAVKKILTGPEMTRRTFDTGLIQMILQAILPTPKLSLTKAPVPVPVPKAKTALSNWSEMKWDLWEIVDSTLQGRRDEKSMTLRDRIEEDLYQQYTEDYLDRWDEGKGYGTDPDAPNWDSWRDDAFSNMSHHIVYDIMNWKVREDPERVQKLINKWLEVDKLQSHHPGADDLEIGTLAYLDEHARRIQSAIEDDLIGNFAKYGDRFTELTSFGKDEGKSKYTEKWFNDNAKNLERIPGAPPAIKDARKHLVKDYEKIKKGEVPFPFREEYILNESDYSLIGWRPLEEIKEAKGPVPLHRKILDDSHRQAWYRMGRDWPQDIVEEVLQEGGDYSDLMQKYLEQPKLPKVVLDKNLTWIDKEIDRLKNIWENEDALSDMTKFRFASFPEQLSYPFGTLKDIPDTSDLPNWYDRIMKLREEVSPSEVGDLKKWQTVHNLPRKERMPEYEEMYRIQKLIEASPYSIEQYAESSPEVRKKIIIDSLMLLSEELAEQYKTGRDLVDLPNLIPYLNQKLGDEITEAENLITEVQTTPDPITRTIDETITKLQKETEFQDQKAQKAKTTGDVLDQIKSRRQFLLPHKKNTGGLVGLYY